MELNDDETVGKFMLDVIADGNILEIFKKEK
jgi:hypothetical protein